MRMLRILVLTALTGCVVPAPARAQPLFGFGTFSLNGDVNGQMFPGASGGILLDVAGSWLSVGGQADLFTSWPYFAGRGGPIAQVNILRGGRVRIFALGGIAWGEQGGPMLGAGLDAWTRGRFGLRVSVQDYLVHVEGIDCAFVGHNQASCEANVHGGQPYTGHQPSVQIGIIWR